MAAQVLREVLVVYCGKASLLALLSLSLDCAQEREQVERVRKYKKEGEARAHVGSEGRPGT